MFLVSDFRVIVMVAPGFPTDGQGLPAPVSACTVPSGQNSSVGDAVSATPNWRYLTGPSLAGRAVRLVALGVKGYFVWSQRSFAESFASGVAGVPISSSARKVIAVGQLNRTRIGCAVPTAF